ncbi:MAG TPA: type II secretion system protein [Candidatus Eisenbacteria bacterium]|nr:type II secretion system protein [Candidatus Eisenbacteria bacterium]
MHHKKLNSKGFTLIELLIVIGIIGFLAAAVLVAVDPVKRIQDSRDARRYSETNAMLNAILTKQVDDRALYSGMTTAPVITQAGANVQVIVSDDTGVVCNAAATRPGCNKALDTAGANKNCVANLSSIGTGPGTATSSAAVVTGSGTSFDTQVVAGDTLTSASTGVCTVLTVTNATSITCTATPGTAFSGTYTITHAAAAVFPTYIASIPLDPAGGTPCLAAGSCTTLGNLAIGTTNSGYYIARTAGNRIEIGACKAEQATAISVKR